MNALLDLANGPLGPDVVPLLGLLVLGLLLLLGFAFMGDGQRKALMRRVARITARRAGKAKSAKALSVKLSTTDSEIAFLDRLIKSLPQRDQLRQRLARAGMEMSLGIYLLASVLVAILSFALAMVSGLVPTLAAVFLGIFGGLGLPHAFVGFMAGRRQNRFITHFPDAIDLMVRGLKSGLPITESIKNAGQEIPDPVGIEFRRITDAMKLGRKLDEVLWETSKRLDLQDFNFFTVSLAIQAETGGNLAETLANLSGVLRGRRQLKLKIKALSSEAKASAYIIGSLPFVMGFMIYMMNSGYLMKLFLDSRGNMMLGAGFACFAIGAFIMYKMVKFEI